MFRGNLELQLLPGGPAGGLAVVPPGGGLVGGAVSTRVQRLFTILYIDLYICNNAPLFRIFFGIRSITLYLDMH